MCSVTGAAIVHRTWLKSQIWSALCKIEPIAMHDWSSSYTVHVSHPKVRLGLKTAPQPLLKGLALKQGIMTAAVAK